MTEYPPSPAASVSSSAPPDHATPPLVLSVVVPTRHEASNVAECYERVAEALGAAEDWELLFVDDSDDETPEAIEALCRRDSRVKLCHRTHDVRTGGLGGAVARGFALTTGQTIVVMDADLQHPPKLIPDLHTAIRHGADIAVASRYVGNGSNAGLDGRYRTHVSQLSKRLASRLLPAIQHTTDPLSGFFALRRSMLARTSLRPDGYKILMELLATDCWDSIADVPFEFEERHSGESKSSAREGLRFVRHTWQLRRRTRGSKERQLVADPNEGLRVLILTSEAPPVVSGIAKTVQMLQRGLEQRGHQVDVTSRQDFPRLIRQEIRISAFALFWPSLAKRLPAYDVVNLHGPVPTISEMFLLLMRTMRHAERPAVVYTHHSDMAIPKLERWCRLYNRLAQVLAHSADAVVVSSRAYASKLARTDGSGVEVIPWAVEIDAVETGTAGTGAAPIEPAGAAEVAVEKATASSVPSATDPHDEQMKVLFVGQLRSYKGVHVLIDAVAELPDVHLTIVGDGPLRTALERQIGERGADNVEMTGRLSDEDLHKAYATHDVITLPSLTPAEAYGIVLAEGMAAGCVPVASDLPGVSEVAEPTGMVVQPGSVESLRDSLAELAADRDMLASLGGASAARVKELTVDSMAKKYEAVFVDGVNTRTRQRGRIAVPERWSGPDQVANALRDGLGISHASVVLAARSSRKPFLRVWSHGEQITATDYDASHFAMQLSEPAIVDALTLDASTRLLLDNDAATCGIFIPLRRTRRGVSLIGLSSESSERELGEEDLAMAMSILHSVHKGVAAA